MFHRNRVWCVGPVSDAAELAKKVCQRGPTWTSCTGFKLGKYLFLNDQLSEDGAGEWGVVLADSLRQIESVTFGWCTLEQALKLINDCLAGEWDKQQYSAIQAEQVQSQEVHKGCALCA